MNKQIPFILVIMLSLVLAKSADAKVCTSLFKSIQTENYDEVKKLISEGCDSNVKESDGYSALMLAAKSGNIEIVGLLLDNGADVNSRSFNRDSALIIAAGRGHAEIVTLLIKKGADINTWIYNGQTALIKATLGKHVQTAKVLLESGAKIDARDNYTKTALDYVDYADPVDSEMVELLKSHGGLYSVSLTPSQTAHIKENEASGAAKVIEKRNTLTEKKHPDNIEVKPEPVDCDTIFTKARAGIYQRLEDMLKTCDVNTRNAFEETVLMVASEWGHLDIVKIILKYRPKVNASDKFGETALMKAAESGELEVVKALLNYGANKYRVDSSHETALKKAIRKGHNDIAELLRGHGKRITDEILEKTSASCRQFLFNVQANNYDDVKAALVKGCSANASDNFGETALMKAAEQGHKDIMELLLEYGAYPDFTDKRDGDTALIKAVKRGQTRTVEVLLNSSANLYIRNKSGDTALKVAKKRGKRQIVNMLEDAGSR